MKAQLSISNIAWPFVARAEAYRLLATRSVKAVEIAPTKFGSWRELSPPLLDSERDKILRSGLEISSYQSLLFEVNEAKLLSSESSFSIMLAQIDLFCSIAYRLSGGGVAVLGAPKARNKGVLPYSEARELAVARFRVLADCALSKGVVLALEASPIEYGGDFLITTAECARMVRAVNHNGLRLHLDTGCADLCGEDVETLIFKNRDILAHVHLSTPFLKPLDKNFDWPKIASALNQVGYDRYAAIEMREVGEALVAVSESLSIIQSSPFLNRA